MLPIGARSRQLSMRALLAGMCLAQAGPRPAHLTGCTRRWLACPKTTGGGRLTSDDQTQPHRTEGNHANANT